MSSLKYTCGETWFQVDKTLGFHHVYMLLAQVKCETCPFSLHRLILLYILPIGMKFLPYHSNACDVMCCVHAISPLRKKFIQSRIKIRCLLIETLNSNDYNTSRHSTMFLIQHMTVFCEAKLPLLLHSMVGHVEAT